MRKFKLYVMPTNAKNIEIANGERFNRITSDYIMIYSEQEKPDEAVEVTEKDMHRLKKQEREWLLDSNKILIIESTRDSVSEIASNIEAKLDEFEALLKDEQVCLAKEEDLNGI